jgi:hypothetical protein
MPIINSYNQVFPFEIGTEPYVLKDALIMTQEEYDALTEEQIKLLQQERYDRWYAIVTAPPEETIEETI